MKSNILVGCHSLGYIYVIGQYHWFDLQHGDKKYIGHLNHDRRGS